MRRMSLARSPMSQDPIADVLGGPMDGVVRLAVVHRRARDFRPWGLFELLLKILAFIILIPLWIIILFSALSIDTGAEGGGGLPTGGGRKKDRKRKYSKSSLYSYHHEILLRLIGADGQTIAERQVRTESVSHAEQLMATILTYAKNARLIVSESLDLLPYVHGPQEMAQVWYGGRPMMTPPGLRSAESLEPELTQAGFEIERSDHEVVVRRSFEPMSLWVPVIVFGIVAAVGIIGTPLSLILAAPFVMFATWMLRREVGRFLFDTICAVLRMPERFELRLTPGSISYEYRHAWRRARASTEGAALVAVGYSRGLGPSPLIERQDPALRIVGKQQSVRLPERLGEDVGPLLAEWLSSTVLSLKAAHGEHDFRSKCAYCGALYDLEAERGCPKCGAAQVA